MGSLLWTSSNGSAQGFAYSPFGSTPARSGSNIMLPGFNGERLDPVSQTYHLGNGYRTYDPKLMRFNAPDSWSPFGSGSLNQYAYCEGDPINQSDPSGHMGSGTIGGIFGAILGILGAGLAVCTFGASIGAIAALETASAITAGMAAEALASGLGVAAAGTGIASAATAKSDPGLSQTLGWVSLGLGIASFTTGAIDAIHAKVTGRSASFDLLDDSEAKINADGTVTLGFGNAEGIRGIDGSIMTFTDVDDENGTRQFNVYAHSVPRGNNSRVLAGGLGRNYNARDLFKAIKSNKEMKLIFDESDSPNDRDGVFHKSFAEKFSILIGKPVIGFKGDLKCKFPLRPSDMINRKFKKTGGLYFGKAVDALNHKFEIINCDSIGFP